MIIGHDEQRAELVSWDYPAVLLYGPESVGKSLIARSVIVERAIGHDLMVIPHLTADNAGEAERFVMTAPVQGLRRYVLADLDGASATACNRLLKTLEEPPPTARFYLVASQPVFPTIISRCQVLVFGILTDQQVEEVLVQAGMSPEVARQQAPIGRGRVRPAMDGVSPEAMAKVGSVLRAMARRDSEQLATALREWDGEAHELLGLWCAEAAVSRWHTFSPQTAPELSEHHARRMLGALASYPLAAPALAASAALSPLCVPSA
jgi:hypothetical protein